MHWRPAHWMLALALASAAHAVLIHQVLPADIGLAGPGQDVALDLRVGLSAPLAAPAPPAQPKPAPAQVTPQADPRPRQAAPSPQARPQPEAAGPRAPATPGGEAVADYYARLQAWLNAHKRYPTEARHRGLQGVAELEFQLARDGRVRWSRVASSSGHRMLDTAAEQLMAQASPMPKPPPTLGDDDLRLRVPISYSLY